MSYQSGIRSVASWILTETCDVCHCDYIADGTGICDNCADRLTVEIPALDEPFAELTDADVIASHEAA